MSRFFYLFAFLAFTITLTAQTLPESWSVSPDGRMLLAGGANDQGFYRYDQIREVELEFTQPDWWQRLLNNYRTGTDLLATCRIDGIRYDSVGVRFKGKSSFRGNDTEKKSFNITLDRFIDGQDVDGYNTFNLNGGWEDTTSMREIVYNNVGHHYYMSLKSNFVHLKINGEDWGPYANVQQLDSDYIKEWYLSNDGTIWRAENIDGGTPGAGIHGRGKSTLNYNGPDSTDYNRDYTLKRTEQEDPWSGLIAACDVLNNTPLSYLEKELARVLDVDKTCWFLAHENVFGDSDSYINKGGSDYYLYYEPETGRIMPLEYDGNGVLLDQLLGMPLFFHASDFRFILMHRMLAAPSIRQRYLAHVRVILDDYFHPEFINPMIDEFDGMINTLVRNDPKKFYTYDQYRTALVKLKQAVISRRSALLSEPELLGVESLTIDDVAHSVDDPVDQPSPMGGEVHVKTRIGGGPAVAMVWLHYGTGLTGPFAKTEMYDDGLHDDGAAGDGLYGASIPAQTSAQFGRYYVAAVAADAAATVTYAPKGAEHDVYLYKLNGTSALAGELVINEFMAANDTTQADQDGEFDDWIELYNNTDENIALGGFHLTDDAHQLTRWTFPAGTTVAAKDYLIVWADDDLEQEGLHAGFKLSAGGETLLLVDAELGIVDSLTYGRRNEDVAHGRFPNGSGDFRDMSPTFNATNRGGVVSTPYHSLVGADLTLFPNPANGNLNVLLKQANAGDLRFRLLTADGRVIQETVLLRGGTSLQINVSNLPEGVYLLSVAEGRAVKTHKVIVRW